MKKLYLATSVTIVLMLVAFCCFTYGNPQSSKYVFMWQAHVHPAIIIDKDTKDLPSIFYFSGNPRLYYPPQDLTGLWRVWDSKGNLTVAAEYKEGSESGIYLRYYEGTNQPKSAGKHDHHVTIRKNWKADGTLHWYNVDFPTKFPSDPFVSSNSAIFKIRDPFDFEAVEGAKSLFDEELALFRKRVEG